MQKVVLAGASNLKHSSACFSDTDFSFVDISTPGWMPNVDSIKKLTDQVKELVSYGATAFVFCLLGNSSVCFEQFDGSTSLPFQSQREVLPRRKSCGQPPALFTKTVDLILPVLFEKKDAHCVIVPPRVAAMILVTAPMQATQNTVRIWLLADFLQMITT